MATVAKYARNQSFFLKYIRFFLTGLLLISEPVIAEQVKELAKDYRILQKKLKSSPDSVRQILLQTPPDSHAANPIKAQYYLVLSNAYYSLAYPDKAFESANLGLSFVKESEQSWLYFQLQFALARALDIQGKAKAGEAIANKALAWAEKVKDKNIVVEAYFSRGVIRTSLSDYLGALNDLQKAYFLAPEKYSNENELHLLKGDIASSIALIYEYRGEASLALPYYAESVRHCRQYDYTLELSIALYGLGRATKNTGDLALGKSQLEEALQISQKINDEQGGAYVLNAIADIDLKQGRWRQAEKKLLQAIDIFTKANNVYTLLNATQALSAIYLEQGTIEQAENYLKIAKSYLKPDSMLQHSLMLARLESQILARKGEFEAAYVLLMKTEKARAELLKKQSIEQLHRLRTQYELDTKEKQNLLLESINEAQKGRLDANKRENRYLYWLIGLFSIALSLLLLHFYQNRQYKRHLERLASTDSLTDLSNRRRILKLLQRQIDYSNRTELDLCIAIADLDLFKRINDQWGHAVGDKVLKEFAKICRRTLRKIDSVGRIGGEEFMILLPNTDIKGAEKVMNKLRAKVEKIPDKLKIDDLLVTVSIGVGLYQKNQEPAELLKQVDQLLYLAKEQGRNKVVTESE